ncbi:MAG: hypothetical protein PWQ85_1141 [Geotoga sp.]|nr:hypothetical protein [Geotoga sp.]
MRKKLFLVILLVILSFMSFANVIINDFESLSGISNDNTGAIFKLNNRYVQSGKYSLEILPSGNAPETKVAFEFSGDKLQKSIGNDTLILSIYLSPDMQIKPNKFFLGMADITKDWQWVDGIFSNTTVKNGWNLVEYKLSEKMKNLDPNKKYMFYFSFFNDNGTEKTPLTEKFYIDSLVSVNSKESLTKTIYIWTMDSLEEIKTFSNDNTGATFEFTKDYAAQGIGSMKITPNGKAIETKVAINMSGEKLKSWIGKNKVSLNVFVPEDPNVKLSMFFLGMADVTKDWQWVGGIFSEDKVNPGWNKVSFKLPKEMSELKETGKYVIYLAFAGFDKDGQKVPLVTPFYLDGIYVEESEITHKTVEDLLNEAPNNLKVEVKNLLELDDEQLLEEIQKRAFMYFWNEANPENGLVKDRSTENSPCSIAAVGMALSAIPVGVERGWITREQGYERALTTLKTFAEGKVEGKNGFFYHFVNMNNGKRAMNSEISSIDTAILIAGALTVGAYFENTEIEKLAYELYDNVNWQWMLNGEDTLSMGWKPEAGFLGARWDSFNEGLLAYILAIGSRTYPIPASSWDKIYRPVKNDTYIYLPQETLFVYQYPNIWIDFRKKEDKFANYFNNAAVATRYNYLYTVQNRFKFETYDLDIWGLSASDGPSGYKAYGASEGNHDGTVAPYAAISSIPFTPELSLKAIRGMLKKYGPLVWGKYGFYSAFNVDQLWFSDQYIGIDQGDIILMIENYRTNLIWNLFMKNLSIKKALYKIGFVEKDSDYAVTPWYAEEFKRLLTSSEEKVAIAVRIKEPITIDGILNEWKDLPKYLVSEDMNVPTGGIKPVDKKSQILHSYFYACWDDENLYLAADVYDEFVVINISPKDVGGYYRTDSIEFYINPQPAGSNAGIFKLAILPFDTEGHVQAVRHEDANPGPISKVAPDVEFASHKTDHGYSIEVKIPFKYLGIKPKEGLKIGFSHTVHNSNKKDAKIGEYVRENIISWNPLPDIWANPQYWGTLELK